MHAISSYRGNRHRPPATNTQTHRQDRLQYTAPLASAQCNNDNNYTVSQKNPCDDVFDDNLNSKRPIVIVFGTVIT